MGSATSPARSGGERANGATTDEGDSVEEDDGEVPARQCPPRGAPEASASNGAAVLPALPQASNGASVLVSARRIATSRMASTLLYYVMRDLVNPYFHEMNERDTNADRGAKGLTANSGSRYLSS